MQPFPLPTSYEKVEEPRPGGGGGGGYSSRSSCFGLYSEDCFKHLWSDISMARVDRWLTFSNLAMFRAMG